MVRVIVVGRIVRLVVGCIGCCFSCYVYVSLKMLQNYYKLVIKIFVFFIEFFLLCMIFFKYELVQIQCIKSFIRKFSEIKILVYIFLKMLREKLDEE